MAPLLWCLYLLLLLSGSLSSGFPAPPVPADALDKCYASLGVAEASLVNSSASFDTCAAFLDTCSTSLGVCLASSRATISSSTEPDPVFNTRYRSTMEIVWSCLTIIFASTWICVHPNVTGYNTTMWQRLRRRLILFALAIFAPELFAVLAFFQWKGCRDLHKEFRDKAIELGIPLVLGSRRRTHTIPGSERQESQVLLGGPQSEDGGFEMRELKSGVEISEEGLDAHKPVPQSPAPPTQPKEKLGFLENATGYTRRAFGIVNNAMTYYHVNEKETAWTLTHAHFIQMGGIVFEGSEGDVGFKRPTIWKGEMQCHAELSFLERQEYDLALRGERDQERELRGKLWQEQEREREWKRQGRQESGQEWERRPRNWTDKDIKSFFTLHISEAFITDKSKGSALAKGLVITQVSWFVVQTIARKIEGLPITHLEVVCLAFTVFNLGMYVCWWDKPLDVEYPLEVSGEPGRDSEPYDWMMSKRRRWLAPLIWGLDTLPVGHWEYSSREKLFPSLYCFANGGEGSLAKYFMHPVSNVQGPLGGGFTLALAFTSASFGALHAIGWSLPSPSYAEHMLWQVSCLVLVAYPLIPMVLAPLTRYLVYRRNNLVTPTSGLGLLLASISGLGAIAYLAARLILIVLPFLELRALPPLAHRTVSWSNFLPHV